MQETKYQELKKENEVMASRIAGQHRLAQSSLVLLKNIDARIEAIKDLMIASEAFSEDQYQDAVDFRLGLRKKADHETVELADVVWVSYEADVEGNPQKQKESSLPVRIGSNAVAFESAILGQRCDAKGITFESVWKENIPSGGTVDRKVVFSINIERVKTRRKDATGNGITDDIDRADGNGGENSDIAMLESDTDNQRSGQPDGNNGEVEHTNQ